MLRFGRMHPEQLQQQQQQQREKEQHEKQDQQAEENLSENNAIAFQPGSPLKILDVGCGIGGTSRYLQPFNTFKLTSATT